MLAIAPCNEAVRAAPLPLPPPPPPPPPLLLPPPPLLIVLSRCNHQSWRKTARTQSSLEVLPEIADKVTVSH